MTLCRSELLAATLTLQIIAIIMIPPVGFWKLNTSVVPLSDVL